MKDGEIYKYMKYVPNRNGSYKEEQFKIGHNLNTRKTITIVYNYQLHVWHTYRNTLKMSHVTLSAIFSMVHMHLIVTSSHDHMHVHISCPYQK